MSTSLRECGRKYQEIAANMYRPPGRVACQILTHSKFTFSESFNINLCDAFSLPTHHFAAHCLCSHEVMIVEWKNIATVVMIQK